VSAQEAGLLPISQHALKFHGRLAYHDYEGIALGLDNALAGGQALRVPGVQVQALTAEQFETADSAEIVQLTWQAARRLIDAQAAQFQS